VRRLPLLALTLALALAPHPGWADSATAVVDVVKVQGVIDPALASYLRSTLEAAERLSSTVVLQIDSTGSYGDRAVALADLIRRSRVPVVAWVGPSGARAEGGALFLLYASGLAAMAPGAGLGPAVPLRLGPSPGAEAEERRLGARLLALAPGSGAREAGVEALLRGPALPAGPALRSGAVALVAADLPDLLRRVDGRSVRTADGPVRVRTVGTRGAPVVVRFHDIGIGARILHAVSTPTAVYVLLVLSLWAIAFELTQPGIGMAGIAGVLGLGFAGYGLAVVPVRWAGLAVLVLGMALQGLDVLLRRVAWLTLTGCLAFAAGSFLAWWGVGSAIDLSWWLVALLTVGGGLFFGFGMTVALRSRERIRAAQVGLVGLTGEVRSDLDPEGGVVVKGAVWRARSLDGPIPKGRRVRVRSVDGLVLEVEEEPPE
jgi:membrane-bound serine protease (ClpP class)